MKFVFTNVHEAMWPGAYYGHGTPIGLRCRSRTLFGDEARATSNEIVDQPDDEPDHVAHSASPIAIAYDGICSQDGA
jgi:hypothetical protein